MKKKLVLILAGLFLAVSAYAHTPLCSCYDNGDGTITCEGGFSDGSSASGVNMYVKSTDGKVLIEGVMDEDSEFTFDKPDGDFVILFDAGEGHRIETASGDVEE